MLDLKGQRYGIDFIDQKYLFLHKLAVKANTFLTAFCQSLRALLEEMGFEAGQHVQDSGRLLVVGEDATADLFPRDGKRW